MHATTTQRRPVFELLTMACVCVALAGCSWDQLVVQSANIGLIHRHVERLALLAWETRLDNSGDASSMGVMCRVYFFDGTRPMPFQPAGEVVFTMVEGLDQKEAREIGKFEITADRLASHLRRDLVGDSYLFWLPVPTPEHRRVFVQCKYLGDDGKELSSSMIAVEVGGKTATMSQSMRPFVKEEYTVIEPKSNKKPAASSDPIVMPTEVRPSAPAPKRSPTALKTGADSTKMKTPAPMQSSAIGLGAPAATEADASAVTLPALSVSGMHGN